MINTNLHPIQVLRRCRALDLKS